MTQFSSILINWHKEFGRKDLPWQINKTPYKVWISEIMLQQTQVNTVIPYFKKFIKKFPDIPKLADTNQDQVLALWSGLGYYARARNLHKTAKILKKDYNSLIPDSIDDLVSLPGIGRSTAGAILSLGFNKKAPILDGNVKRVITRYKNIQDDITKAKGLNNLWSISEELLPKKRFSTYNQSLMDVGATVCKKINPVCNLCPISKECKAKSNNTIHLVPYKKKMKTRPSKKVFWLLPYTDSGHIYLRKRPPEGLWGGLWTFLENNDLKNLIKENNVKLKMNKSSLSKLTKIKHNFSHYELEAELYLIKSGISKKDNDWKNFDELENLGMPKPVSNLLDIIKNHEKISLLQKV